MIKRKFKCPHCGCTKFYIAYTATAYFKVNSYEIVNDNFENDTDLHIKKLGKVVGTDRIVDNPAGYECAGCGHFWWSWWADGSSHDENSYKSFMKSFV